MEIIEPEKGKSEKEDINLNQISQNQIKTSNSVTDSSYSISVSLSILLIRERVIEASKACKDIFVDSCEDKTRDKDVVKIVNQISGCHGIFIRIENPLLTTLQTDLGRSSSEIFSLYQEDVDMNLKLRNRHGVRRAEPFGGRPGGDRVTYPHHHLCQDKELDPHLPDWTPGCCC